MSQSSALLLGTPVETGEIRQKVVPEQADEAVVNSRDTNHQTETFQTFCSDSEKNLVYTWKENLAGQGLAV